MSTTSTTPATVIKEGTKVQVNYRGRGRYYPGIISKIHYDDKGDESYYDIAYDDGETESKVNIEFIQGIDGKPLKPGNNKSKTSASSSVSLLRRGAKVEANYQGNGIYQPGRITKEDNDGYFTIEYDNGGVESQVSADKIRLAIVAMEGLKVEANYRGRGKYYPGKISKVHDDDGTYDIDYDDGEKESRVPLTMLQSQGSPIRAMTTEERKQQIKKNKKKKIQRLEEGCKVNADYRGKGKIYPGRIRRDRGDGTYDIDYDDGEVESRVHEHFICLLDNGEDDADDDTIIPCTSLTTERVIETYCAALCFTKDNNSFIAGSTFSHQGDAMTQWDITTGTANHIWKDYPNCLLLSLDGQYIFAGSTNDIKVWALNVNNSHESNQEPMKVLSGHESTITTLCCSKDGKFLISGSKDKSIHVWDWKSGKQSAKLNEHSGSITALCMSNDGKLLLSASEDSTICIWDLSKSGNELQRTLSEHQYAVYAICLSKDDKLMYSGSLDKTIRIWDWKSSIVFHTLKGHGLAVKALTLSLDDSKLISASADGTIRVWDVALLNKTGELKLEVYREHTNAIVALCLSSDGSRLLTSCVDGTVRVWKTKLQSNKDDGITQEQTKTSFESANAINDSSRIGVDRLGFTAYAQAMYSVLSEAEPPVCVGLYARWGSGKSFMIQLLKYYFDKTVSVRKSTKELVQWYEDGWSPPVKGTTTSPTGKHSESSIPKSFLDRCKVRFRICHLLCCKLVSLIQFIWFIDLMKSMIKTIFPNENYVFGLLWDLVIDLHHEWNGRYVQSIWLQVRKVFYSCYHGHDYMRLSADEFDVILLHDDRMMSSSSFTASSTRIFPGMGNNHDEETGNATNPTSSQVKSEREYLFVDFNAWEFSRSDELWAGLIRNIYHKVELRLSQHNSDNFKARKGNNRGEDEDNDGDGEVDEQTLQQAVDWKQLWRIKKAKDLLLQYYGGSRALRLRLMTLLLLGMGVVATIVLSAVGIVDIWTRLISGVSQALSVVAGIVGVVIAAIPSLKLLYKTNNSVNTSRGDVIFKEANRVQDSIGFLSRVRGELDEFFQFMREYEEATQIRLILVVFVDDLDRCLEGRNVKVLEAIQLILAIPGAPVIAFLAIDSRVVVASIEATINKSLSIRDALISGYEYMDKIVQVPFCLPEAPQEKVKRYIDSCIVKAADPISIKKMMEAYVECRIYSNSNQRI